MRKFIRAVEGLECDSVEVSASCSCCKLKEAAAPGPHVDYRTYDLQAKYNHFNHWLFGGKLPVIPLSFNKIKGKAGMVKFKVQYPAGWKKPSNREVKYLGVDPLRGATVLPGSIQLILDNTFLRTEQQLDATLLHEMIHVYMIVIGRPGEVHGPNFTKMRQEISRIVGYEIPETEDIFDAVQADTRVFPVGVIVLKGRNGQLAFSLLNPNFAQANAATLQAMLAYRIQHLQGEAALYIVSSPWWSDKALKIPLARTSRTLRFWKIPVDDAALADLTQKGRLLFSVP